MQDRPKTDLNLRLTPALCLTALLACLPLAACGGGGGGEGSNAPSVDGDGGTPALVFGSERWGESTFERN